MATTIPDVWRAQVRKVAAESLLALARSIPGCYEIALSGSRVLVMPGDDEKIGVLLVKGAGLAYESMLVVASPAEAGAIIFALEQSADCIDQRKARDARLDSVVRAVPTFDKMMSDGPGVVL